jgi:hypothetical protein
MQTLILAAGALLIIFLITLALPLGFTMKGKVLISLVSFILALGGIAAVTVVELWQAGLMLLALVLISAYFIDKKLNAMMYQKTMSFDDEDEEELEVDPPSINGLPVREEEELLIPVKKSKQEDELPDLKVTPASIPVDIEAEIGVLHVQEDQLVASNIPSEELTIDSLSDIESLLAKELIESTDTSLAEVAVTIEEEDISFLFERETEQTTNDGPEILTPETGYLSDIESLLELESEEVAASTDDANEKDKDEDLPQLEVGTNPLDESIFDFLNKSKEADSDHEDTLEVIEDRKKIANL